MVNCSCCGDKTPNNSAVLEVWADDLSERIQADTLCYPCALSVARVFGLPTELPCRKTSTLRDTKRIMRVTLTEFQEVL